MTPSFLIQVIFSQFASAFVRRFVMSITPPTQTNISAAGKIYIIHLSSISIFHFSYVSPPLHLPPYLYKYLPDDGACFRARGSRRCWPLTSIGWRLGVTRVCAALCMVTRTHRGLVTRGPGVPVCGPDCSLASPASWSLSPSRSS